MLNTLWRYFPGLPVSQSQMKACLFFSCFITIVAILAIWLQSLSRMLAVEALFLQLVGAFLLWWKSIGEDDKIDVVVSEIKEFNQNPQTKAERVVY